MNCTRNFVLALLLIFTSLSLSSQSAVGIFGSLSYGDITSNFDYSRINSDYGGEFGVFYTRPVSDKLSLVAQVSHEHIAQVDNGTNKFLGDNTRIYYNANAINLYVGVNYDFILSRKFKIGLLVLPKISLPYRSNNHFYDLSNTGPVDGAYALSTFLNLDAKANLQYAITEKMNLLIRPGYLFNQKTFNPNFHQRSWSVDLGVTRRLAVD